MNGRSQRENHAAQEIGCDKQRKLRQGAATGNPRCAALGTIVAVEPAEFLLELGTELAGSTTLLDSARRFEVALRHLHFHASESRCIWPVVPDVMLVCDRCGYALRLKPRSK